MKPQRKGKGLYILLGIIISLFFILIIGVYLINNLSASEKTMVLSVTVPGSADVVELWEKPLSSLPLIFPEYETWFAYKQTDDNRKWFLIHNEYIVFRKVTILISSDHNKIRIETTGKGYPSHMIAEYDVNKKSIRLESEATVRNSDDWHILIEKEIR